MICKINQLRLVIDSQESLFVDLDQAAKQTKTLTDNISSVLANIRDKKFGGKDDPAKPKIN